MVRREVKRQCLSNYLAVFVILLAVLDDMGIDQRCSHILIAHQVHHTFEVATLFIEITGGKGMA